MALLHKLFGGLKMSWPATVLFALGAGLYTAVMNSIPLTEGTSFRDIAVSYEWWVVFAFIIASNCKKGWESALKTFVFFLISQPLIFGVEVLLGTLSADMAWYYYSTIWGPITLLTLPGGFIAHLITRQDALGCIILGLGCAIDCLMGVSYTLRMLSNPPYHLLTAVCCFVAAVVMCYCIQHDNKRRAASLLIALGVTVVFVALVVAGERSLM